MKCKIALKWYYIVLQLGQGEQLLPVLWRGCQNSAPDNKVREAAVANIAKAFDWPKNFGL